MNEIMLGRLDTSRLKNLGPRIGYIHCKKVMNNKHSIEFPQLHIENIQGALLLGWDEKASLEPTIIIKLNPSKHVDHLLWCELFDINLTCICCVAAKFYQFHHATRLRPDYASYIPARIIFAKVSVVSMMKRAEKITASSISCLLGIPCRSSSVCIT